MVENVSPADQASGVDVSADVTATFSETMDEASVEATGASGLPITFTLNQGTSTIDATVTYAPLQGRRHSTGVRTALPVATAEILKVLPSPVLGQDELRAKLVALVGEPGFVVDASAAVRKR